MDISSPVCELRSGLVKAAIWRNDREDRSRFSVALTRLYKTGNEWRDSRNFRLDDLSRVVEVAALAMRWIGQQPDGARGLLQPSAEPALEACTSGQQEEIHLADAGSGEDVDAAPR